MNFDVDSRTILLVRHGSHAYGLNMPKSDEDFKGVCIKPKEAYFGFTQKFEQHEHMGSKTDGIDKVVYSIEKFMSLAADCNPNIIEVLHVDSNDIIKIDSFGEELRSHADEFLSKKAKFTFAGYANAQLHRIKTHRKWLLDPPQCAPFRPDFGLNEVKQVSKSELGAYDSAVEKGFDVSSLPENVVTLFTREKAYQAAVTHYAQYLNWVRTRNPDRAKLEAAFGFDTKHGMHLMRLQMMGNRILEKHIVQVKWTGAEREYLMSIRNGAMRYDDLVAAAEKLEAQSEELYLTSTLRREPDRAKLDRLNVDMTERYLRLHG